MKMMFPWRCVVLDSRRAGGSRLSARRSQHALVLAAGAAMVFAGCGGGGPVDSSPPPSAPVTTSVPAPAQADYRISFEASWSAASHPQDFPPDPHFSGIIGATHRPGFRMYEPGELASDGIEAMAERGSKSPLDAGLTRAIAEGNAERIVSGDGIQLSPGEVSQDFRVSQEFPAVSVTLMLAPSPDWFVGVSAVNLFENGQWVESLVIDAFPYDAGTDSGRSYASADRDTNPPEPIALISSGPLVVAGTTPLVGRFRIERQ